MRLRAGVIVLLFAAVPAAAQPTPRIAALREWMALAAQHAPGRVDASAAAVRDWDREALQFVRDDLHAVRIFMCGQCSTPSATRRPVDEPPEIVIRDGRPDWVPHYSKAHLNDLSGVAREVDAARFNDLLKRGALLHTDVALRAPPIMAWAPAAVSRPLARTVVHVADGQQYGVEEAVDHLEMARRLLDLVTPDPAHDRDTAPARDETVLHWYRSTMATLVQTRQLDSNHARAALALFPNDAELLVLAAAMHEALAAPRFQEALAAPSVGGRTAIESEREELRQAEQLLRRALSASPAHAEARLRLGHVLGRLGRHSDALAELRAVAMASDELLLLYYAHLFIGRGQDALERPAEARAAYARAAALFPEAQSPYLSLSELEMRSGNRAAALKWLEELWTRSVSAFSPEDPWIHYLQAAGRRARAQLAALGAAFPPVERP